VSNRLAQKIGLKNLKILQPKQDYLLKLVCYIPENHLENVRSEIFKAGGGKIGAYDSCSFTSNGEGTFKANEGCNPFVGKIGKLHTEKEIRMEVILPKHLKSTITRAILTSHPYEEPAFDFFPLQNSWNEAGLGIIGNCDEEYTDKEFLVYIKDKLQLTALKHTKLVNKKISKVAVCGGSGADLLQLAKSQKADIFISGDFKYHDYFLAENEILIVDIGHFESEQFTKEIFFEQVTKKLPKFAVHFSEINTNPINYL
jgi:hypothetical protein